MSSRTRARSVTGAMAALAVTGALIHGAPAASAANTIADCLAANAGITDIVCHEVTLAPSPRKSVGRVRVSWQLVPGRFDSLQGGLWMVRSPIAGQREGEPSSYPRADSREQCSNGNPAGFQSCAQVYSGTSGSFILEFPRSTMGGYQFVLNASETLSNAQGEEGGADLRGNEVNSVVWVWKGYSDRGAFTRTCRNGSTCIVAVKLVLNSDVGTGMPVRPLE